MYFAIFNNRGVLPSLGIALCLVACDDKTKQADTDVAAAPTPPARRSTRERPKDSSASRAGFRKVLDDAMQIEDAETRDKAIAEVAISAAEIAPKISAEAFGFLSAETGNKPAVLRECIGILMLRGEDEALRWADALASGEDTTAAKSEIALALAERQPDQAMKLLSESGVSMADPDGAATLTLQTWISKDPAKAASWAQSSPGGPGRDAAITTVASQWMRTDSAAASSWMNSLRDQSARQTAVSAVAESISSFPLPLRNSFLQETDPQIRAEIEREIEATAPLEDAPGLPQD